jgi:hypothetical protein
VLPLQLLPAAAAAGPLQQCASVNAWCVVWVGTVLPLAIMYRQERNARWAFYQRWRRWALGLDPDTRPKSAGGATGNQLWEEHWEPEPHHHQELPPLEADEEREVRYYSRVQYW